MCTEFMSETWDFDTKCIEKKKKSRDNFSFSVAKFKKGFKKNETFSDNSMVA